MPSSRDGTFLLSLSIHTHPHLKEGKKINDKINLYKTNKMEVIDTLSIYCISSEFLTFPEEIIK